jgi:hypothetical protein
MANLTELPDAATGQQIDAVLQRLRTSKDVGADLLQVLDIAIGITGADMGTLQRFDERTDCLTIVASRGFSREALTFFGIVRRDTNTTCAAALMRRMVCLSKTSRRATSLWARASSICCVPAALLPYSRRRSSAATAASGACSQRTFTNRR